MTDLPPQSYSNHRRFMPLFHFFALPVILLYVIYSIIHTVRHVAWSNLAEVAFGVAVLTFALATRGMVITVQDRLIRLEMRLRLSQLLPAETKVRIDELRPGQLVALRFASDAEMPALVARVFAGEFANGDAIKRAITAWQADRLRA
jgi:hypothetical protein